MLVLCPLGKSFGRGYEFFFIGSMSLWLSMWNVSFLSYSLHTSRFWNIFRTLYTTREGWKLVNGTHEKNSLSPHYQLAFVLETQMYSVQSKLFIETVLLLQYELAHLGTDFSSRFEWLKN
ncbi:hypothetical protein PC129_g16901 [Phytophthora cactorum]|uniref:Uncharacterized protein n=1 Tax=Phytophthora cactorum TaxID=29920 RepID=A0A8T1B046_9STRA|nr:hypothetical protein PC113_g21849 [Phytophthora cactorum]KAG2876248.1 hypothetical protein PC114_g24295 [Phytophthora cactorum]KAG2883362.1 hypothetical protein PC115_g21638 [Phytophthora cactorum]KAG2891476.1 hypothetical protein PC117_g24237 [Phytophthora cactorum]KAG2961941.1 hypothetical protein PC118_g21690 [Phytophthora cactorum]